MHAGSMCFIRWNTGRRCIVRLPNHWRCGLRVRGRCRGNPKDRQTPMATPTAGDVLVETLIKWKVDTVFGLPGYGINGIIEVLRARRIPAFRSAMKKPLPSMPAVMPNGSGSLASVSRRLVRLVPAAFTSSTAFTMASSMVSRCWLLRACSFTISPLVPRGVWLRTFVPHRGA
jgi:hypothetical protein